jgi:hypothetical protein
MKGTGSTTGCMAKERSVGSMAGVTKATTNTTRSTVMVLSYGQMAANMWDTGKTANSMEEASTIFQMGIKRLENGSRARRSSGSKITHKIKHDTFRFCTFGPFFYLAIN